MLSGNLTQAIAVEGEEGRGVESSGGICLKDRGKLGSDILLYFRLFGSLTHVYHRVSCHPAPDGESSGDLIRLAI